MAVDAQIHPSWKTVLKGEFQEDYFSRLKAFLIEEKAMGKTIYPRGEDLFNAFNLCPIEKIKVVILGQDPYHGPGQAHGLCFSVKSGIRPPPSLLNIFKELKSDCGVPTPSHGNLEAWAHQGVFLLNSILTVSQGQPGSHGGKGWEKFTDSVCRHINEKCQQVVFLLWGNYAQVKGQMIDKKKHKVLTAPHPSPFSADRGFFGCQHFSQSNAYLTGHGKTPIDWSLSKVVSPTN